MRYIIKLFCIVTLIFVSFVFPVSAKDSQDSYSPNLTGIFSLNTHNFCTRKYILGPNDVISISVQNAPEFNQNKIRIQPDGKIFLSSIGSLQAADLTIDELYKILDEKYSYYVKRPKITLNLEETRSFIVYVTGAVLNPGSYELKTYPDDVKAPNNTKLETLIERRTPLLSNILVAAGGISYDADLEHIQISNSIDHSKFEVNLLDLLDNGNTNQDIYLMTGDSIHIPRLPSPLAIDPDKYKRFAGATFSPQTIPVKVIGYVNNPGLIKLDSAQSLNLNSAITSAGGYLHDSAYAPQKVFLSRIDNNGKLVTKAVNPMSNDLTLMPNDIIYVPENSRPLVGKAFDYMTRVITPISSVANSYNSWALMFDPGRYLYVGR